MEPHDPRTFDVFLSYARDDETRVSVVQRELEAQGLQVWRDRGQIRPGDTWIKKLEVGLRESRCVVLFHSQNAAASEWVQREWNVALTVQMPIIPVRLDDSELPLLLKPVQCVDFPTAERLHAAVAEILSGVRGDLPTPVTPPQNANPSVLGPDVAILDRMIVREATAATRLETARWVAAGVGVATAVGVAIFLGGVETLWTGAMATGALIVAGFIGWAITAQVSSNRSEVMRLSTIKDGIELYCPNQPACTEFRVKLETILKRRAGIEEAT
jgi:hypothetical protein